jgi:glutaredoxin
MINYHKVFKHVKIGDIMEESKEGHHTDSHQNEVRIDNNPDKTNHWKTSTIVLGVVAVILLILVVSNGGLTGNVVAGVEEEGQLDSRDIMSPEDAGNKLVEFLNTRTGGGVEYVSASDMGDDLYEVVVTYNGEEIPVYITKDGEYFVQAAASLTELSDQPAPEQQTQEQESAEIPKSDKPKVELFVMTHCPYGTQAEKGMLPVYELLGDKIDSSMRFVHYFMHAPEEDETPIQVCIREEQPDKYNEYLTCFLDEGKTDECLAEAQIDTTALNTCVESNAEKYYNSDSALSQGYGVQGSPTLVINGEIVRSGRSPAAYLEVICSAFNEAPEECSQELDSASPSPGFGYGTASAGSGTAQCG